LVKVPPFTRTKFAGTFSDGAAANAATEVNAAPKRIAAKRISFLID
jgi:hypothetical protein